MDINVSEALRLLAAREAGAGADLARLREAWAEGIASGDGGEIDIAELKRNGRAELDAAV